MGDSKAAVSPKTAHPGMRELHPWVERAGSSPGRLLSFSNDSYNTLATPSPFTGVCNYWVLWNRKERVGIGISPIILLRKSASEFLSVTPFTLLRELLSVSEGLQDHTSALVPLFLEVELLRT